MSTEVDDYNSRMSKRRRVDVGVPRGTHAHHSNKNSASVTNGGGFEVDNSDVLRTLLKNSKKVQNGSTTPPSENSSNSPLIMSQLLQAKAKEIEDLDTSVGRNDENSENEGTDLSSDELETMDGSANDASAIPDNNSAKRVKCNGNSSISTGSMSPGNMSPGNLSPDGEVSPNPLKEDSVKAKRARVENIITSMRQSPSCPQSSQGSSFALEVSRPKRKQAQPQQQKMSEEDSSAVKQVRRQERRRLKYLLSHLQQQLDVLQEKYFDLYEEDNSSLSDASDDLDDLNEPIDTMTAIRKCEMTQAKRASQPVHRRGLNGTIPRESHQKLRNSLKQQLTNAMSTTVDSVIDRFTEVEERRVVNNNNNNTKPRSSHPKSTLSETSNSVLQQAARTASLIVPMPNKRSNPSQSQHSQAPVHQSNSHEQTEAMSLVVPKRGHGKEEALPRTSQADEMKQDHMMPTMLPTSVAIPNPSLHPSFTSIMMTPPSFTSMSESKDVLLEDLRYAHSPQLGHHHHHSQQSSMMNHGSDAGDHPINDSLSYPFIKSDDNDSLIRGSPGLSDLSGYSAANGTSLTSTLTPTHLRKAKLMFFYVRYPSSALLRQYFPDVKFNRHNTSQMIKWFSNFREFYYIQMEKFARQAISDGVEKSEDLLVIRDMELFRSLNMHYNKSNEFKVPESFMEVATTTLREFFEAIRLGKDTEPSWKKTIYKVIGKLDEPLPDFFKSANCLEEMD
ncbi:prospero homeobox protein 1-like [Acanthaster planci]|uniref:Prospero homeobox protein 1-like n=1 Tax=Acanthaster planci TaxID=133434 RepID=A0A8B7XQ95_ACAPL|nr:prospero homeobox protein 1-like [Acanthaster planci]XP_022082992.1 prospero homeobox protein 1-like [Acanthaster planci]XP_022082993.1 prospero homeobox protein 1-like [Acanthaster planci]XP_022082994.1 prospero homeobox protein 1-like [Acanthaster planci]XP_022082995.1 prospero homeobox protein 1-like [Acanthaster planci]XP_022082996.1 prospero homeobox protein 1-like [Acanthaster planci]XP_022082998.1 prospero homeobox protein 1-like [Acanthaster planci]XP_022082999.1 prospero homeobox